MESVIEAINASQITWLTGLIAIVGGMIAGAVGGAIGGIVVGGKHLGNELAALLGSFYGPMAAAPGIVIAMLILAFI